MCGIIGIASNKPVSINIINSLKKLEYRGYDSAGLATLDNNLIDEKKCSGRVDELEKILFKNPSNGNIGIGHVRWATHGIPNIINAHPHSSEEVSVVHNGIIENYLDLKDFLKKEGYSFSSQTDSELIAHLLEYFLNKGNNMLDSMYLTKEKLDGAYAIAAIDKEDDQNIIIARSKSPLLIGIGMDEFLAASDPLAIGQLTNEFIFLEDGDVAELSSESYTIFDESKKKVEREISQIDISSQATSKGEYRHFMEKEIYEQPEAILKTIDGRVGGDDVLDNIFGLGSSEMFEKVKRVQIVACGTSLHAGRVAANWFSAISELPTQIDYASEYRYRNPHVDDDSLLVTISQSG